MHVVVAMLYSTILYLSALLYAVIVDTGHLLVIIVCGPLIISGIVALLLTVEGLLWAMGSRRRAQRRLEDIRLEQAERAARRAAIRDEQRKRAA